jgi:hypothetical protein
MTALAQKLMTAEEFAVWAEKRPEKHWELFDGVPQMLSRSPMCSNRCESRHYSRLVSANGLEPRNGTAFAKVPDGKI